MDRWIYLKVNGTISALFMPWLCEQMCVAVSGSANDEAIYASFFASYLGDQIKKGGYSGHEMHHFLRQSIPLRPIAQADKGMMRALEAVLSEGTADLVDLEIWKEAAGSKDYFIKMTAASPGMLQQLNKDLEDMIPGKKGKDWNYFSTLFEGSSGHFPGSYMSAIMVRNGYRKEMLDHCDDPFAFVRIYNRAALKDNSKPPVFTEKAMRVIAELEKRYKK